jgi:restriction system-associated AAA family ATPase
MKLLRVHIISAKTCGGLLDRVDIWLRPPNADIFAFDPLCLIGPNGTGKSQFLQVLAEMLQSAFHACVSDEERVDGNPDLLFELEYLIRPPGHLTPTYVRVSRTAEGVASPKVKFETMHEGKWTSCDLSSVASRHLLPSKVVAYTSGGNETLSLPFLVSRAGYATEVANRALDREVADSPVADTRLMLIDYGTHLEVLAANLLLGSSTLRLSLLQNARLVDLHSFRCVVQLAHSAVSRAPRGKSTVSKRKGIQLTSELEAHLDRLKRCATCYEYDEQSETYIFDYLVSDATRTAFHHFWKSTLDLYAAFHKLSMLNDLAIPKRSRERFHREAKARRFAARLPEPQDEEKVFRFERVQFSPLTGAQAVDYVSLSDGEHQLAQLLGTMSMVCFPGVLFILDEPESHFNPQWRVECITQILDVPTCDGPRRGKDGFGKSAEQECLLTTHSPFVPSDLHRDKVFIFRKSVKGEVEVDHPHIETYGTTFDTIVEECFDVRPPISKEPRQEIGRLSQSQNAEEIAEGARHFGDSVEKAILLDRARQLRGKS